DIPFSDSLSVEGKNHSCRHYHNDPSSMPLLLALASLAAQQPISWRAVDGGSRSSNNPLVHSQTRSACPSPMGERWPVSSGLDSTQSSQTLRLRLNPSVPSVCA